MKLIKTTISLAFVLAPAHVHAATFVTLQPSEVSVSDAKIDEALLTIDGLVFSGDLQSADLDGLGELVDAYPEADGLNRPASELLRESLQSYIDQLGIRARNAWIGRTHSAFLHDQIIEVQLDMRLQELIFRARNNNWTASHFQAVRAKLVARADSAGQDISSAYLRRRFEELSSQATTRAQGAFMGKLEAFRIEVIALRLDNALRKLRAQRKAGALTSTAYQTAIALLYRQARAAAI